MIRGRLLRLGAALTLSVSSIVTGAMILSQGASAANAHANYAAVCPAGEGDAARCNALVVTDVHGNPLASSAPPAGAYGPAQFHGA